MNGQQLYYRARMLYRRMRAFLGRGWISQRTRIVVESDKENCDSPIFIVGTHRSGTSLLRRILDSHHRIACPPESYWLRHFTVILNDHLTFDGLWNLGFDRQEALLGLRRAASSFHQSYCLAKGKSRWADKTPQYTHHLNTLLQLFGPKTRFVIIFRHPMDVAYSIWNRGWPLAEATGDKLIDSCQYVADSGERQLAFLQQHSECCFPLHYDQLTLDPESTLQRLCEEFLHEPWDNQMLRHHAVDHDFGCEDPVVRGTCGFRGSFGNWHAWPRQAISQAENILNPLMERLGYTSASPFRTDRTVEHIG